MDKYQLNKDFIKYALLFAAFTFLGVLLVFTVGAFGSNLLNVVPYFLVPHDSGLNDHIRYAETVGAIFGLLVYIVYLIYRFTKTVSKTALPWITAAVIEMALLVFSLVDRSIGHAPYEVSNYAASWLQFFVIVPLIVGYVYFAFRASSKSGNRNLKKRA